MFAGYKFVLLVAVLEKTRIWGVWYRERHVVVGIVGLWCFVELRLLLGKFRDASRGRLGGRRRGPLQTPIDAMKSTYAHTDT